MRDRFTEHLERVYRFALRLTGNVDEAQDITQETLLRACRRAGQLRRPDAAAAWLFRIAVNLWRDRMRRSRLAPERAAGLGAAAEVPAAHGDRLVEREDVDRVLRALDALPDRQRQVLHLHAFEELAHEEIAEALGISTAAVKASLSLGRRALRERLAAGDPMSEKKR